MATHTKKSALTFLSREMAQAVTGMPAGVINYLGGRPPVSPSINLFSFLIPKDQANIYMNLNKLYISYSKILKYYNVIFFS